MTRSMAVVVRVLMVIVLRRAAGRRCARRRAAPRRPRRRRCARRSGWLSSSSSSSRTARLRSPAAMPLTGCARPVDVEQASPRAPGLPDRRAAGCHQRIVARRSSRSTSAMSRATGCWRGTGCACRQLARSAPPSRSISNSMRRLRQFVGLAPVRMQFADDADGAARRARCARNGPGAAPGARPATNTALRGASSASTSPFMSKKSTRALLAAPLQRIGARHRPAPATRIGWRDAGHAACRSVGRRHRA